MTDKIRLGISSCLLGRKVRYDGGHKLDHYLVDTLGPFVDYVPVCPEVEAGFPVPREAFRLVGDPTAPRLVTQKTRQEHTERMQQWAQRKLEELEQAELCGFIFKSQSPSSGMERVKVYNERGVAEKKGVGIFARAFQERFPLLPVEEEGRLQDVNLRENFIVRIFTAKRWQEMVFAGESVKGLVDFHSRHKLLVMAHHPERLRQLGKIVADPRQRPLLQVRENYFRLLLQALSFRATVKKNVNVLQHMAGYFKKQLSVDEKRELQDMIKDYYSSLVPLIVPLTLIKHYVRKYGQQYLAGQVYLNPHPLELKLRNHA